MEYIKKAADKLIKKYKTRDPFYICEALRLNVVYKELGSLKGMYVIIKNNRYAVLNSSLSQSEKKTVCAHELGHDILHRGFARDVFLQDFMLYDMKSRPEYEADFFAASLLIDDKEFAELLKLKMNTEDIADSLFLTPQLIDFKKHTILLNYYG